MGRFTRLDHVGIVGTELTLLEPRFERLGFSVTQAQPLVRPDPKTGKAMPLGQSSQHMVFQTGYVELTAITDRTAGNHLEPYIAKYEGVHIIALAVADAEEAWTSLQGAGIEAARPMPLTRDVLYGAGGVAGFKWFPIAEHTTSEAYVCATEHLTPEVVYQPVVQTHPNGAVALSSVIVGVDSLDEARARYEAMFDATSLAEDGTAVIDVGTQRIALVTAEAAAASFPGADFAHWPRVVGFSIGVADLASTTSLLKDKGVRLRDGRHGRWVLPQEAAGALLLFHQA